MKIDQDRLARENGYVLTAVQALLGLIDPSVEAIALYIGDEDLRLRFWTHGDPAVIAQDGNDVVTDMEGMYGPKLPRVVVEIFTESPPAPELLDRAGRFIYWTKT